MRKKFNLFAILFMVLAIILPVTAFAVVWGTVNGVNDNTITVGEFLSYQKTDTTKTYLNDSNDTVAIDLSQYALSLDKQFGIVPNTPITYTYETSASGDNAIKTGTITNYTVENNKICIPENAFVANTGELYTDNENQKQLSGVTTISTKIFAYDSNQAVALIDVTAPVTIVTRLIKTTDDFSKLYDDMTNDWMGIGDPDVSVTDGSTLIHTTLRRWGGYFELGANISYNRQVGTGVGYGRWTDNYGIDYTKYDGTEASKTAFTEIGWSTGYGGFQGTFDGCGYAIDGIDFATAQGLFGGINGHKGVIKNLALTNCTTVTYSNYIAQNNFGTIENIFVQTANMKDGPANNGANMISYRAFGNASIRNVYVENAKLDYTKATIDAVVNVDRANNAVADMLDSSTLENAIAVTQGEDVYCAGGTTSYAVADGTPYVDTTKNIYGYFDIEELASASSTIKTLVETNFTDTVYDESTGEQRKIWGFDTVRNKPYFLSLATPNAGCDLLLARIGLGATISLGFYNGGYNEYVEWSLKTPIDGVTIDNVKHELTTTAAVPDNTKIELIAKFRNNTTREYVVYARAQQQITVSTKHYLETGAQDVLIDIGTALTDQVGYGERITVVGSVSYSYIGLDGNPVTGTEFSNYAYEGTTIKIPVNKLLTSDGKQLSGLVTLALSINLWEGNQLVGNAIVTANVTLVTKVIRTVADVNNWYTLAKQDWTATTQTVGSTTYNVRYGGYFELGNNIKYTGTYATFFNWFTGISYWSSAGGFQGTFDGCGYAIDGITTSAMTGFFGGVIGSRGVVKNIAFTNFVHGAANHNVLTQNLWGGTVENVFIQAKQLKLGGSPNGASALAFAVDANSTVRNVVAVVDDINYKDTSLTDANISYTNIFGRTSNPNQFSNLIAVTGGETGAYHNTTTAQEVLKSGTVYGYLTYAEAIANSADYSAMVNALDNNIWTVNENGFPVFKSATYSPTVELVQNYVVPDGSINLALNESFSSAMGTTWTTSTDGATISGNVLTVSGLPAGSVVTVTATDRYGLTRIYEVAIMDIVTNTDEKQQLQNTDDTTTFNTSASGEIVSVKLNGVSVVGYEYVDGSTITVPKSAYDGVIGEAELVIVTASETNYTETIIPIDAATKFISNKEELLAFASQPRGTTWGENELYVIDADIDMEGAEYGINVNTNGANNVTGTGFAGTFDGRGHVIKNITMVGNGFISGIRRDGVFRNVAFLNATQKSQGFLSMTTHGPTVENIYAQITSEYNGNAGFLGGDNYSGKCFSNIVVDVTGKVGNYYLLHSHYNRNYGTLKDVYMIGATGITAGTTSNPSSSVDSVQLFADYTALKAGGNDTEGNAIVYTDMDNDFWDIVDGVPVPVALKSGYAPTITSTQTANLPLNAVVKIEGNPGVYTKYALTSAVDGVTVNGRFITLTDASAGKLFTVGATNQVTGEYAEKTFTAIGLETLEFTGDIDKIDDTTSFELIDGMTGEGYTKLALTLNGAEPTSYTFENDTLTLNRESYSSLANKYKEANGTDNYYTLTLRTRTNDSEYLVNGKIYVADMVIMDKAELYEFSKLERGTLWGVGETYVLGADIDYKGDEYSINIDVSGNNYVTNATSGATGNGFAGTFDGCGRIINDIHVVGNGFISGLRSDGAFRNVSFTNAKQSATGFICRGNVGSWSNSNCGTIENIYIQVESLVTQGAVFGCGNYGNSRWNNIVVDVTDKVGTYYFVSYCYHKNHGAFNGVYGINVDGIVGGTAGGTSSGVDVTQVFANFDAFKAGGTDNNGTAISYATMDNDFWDIVDGVPVPVALKQVRIVNDNETALLPGTDTTVKVIAPYLSTVTMYEKVDASVTFDEATRTITVFDYTDNGSITIEATSKVGGYSAKKEFAIKSASSIETLNRVDYDLNGAGQEGFTFALAPVLGSSLESDIEAIKLDGEDFDYTIENIALTIDRDFLNLESMLGEHAITFVVGGSENKTYVLPITVCTKIITTKAEMDQMADYRIALDYDEKHGEGGVGYYILGADIDMEGGRLGQGNWINDDGTHTNYMSKQMYRSTFDGRGYTLSNVIQTNNASALFAYGQDCVVKNLNIVNAEIADTNSLLIYDVYGDGALIENVFIQGKVTRNAQSYSPSSFVLGKSRGNVVMNNVYIVINDHNLTDVADDLTSGAGDTFFGAYVPKFKLYGGTATFNNCYALNLTDETGKGNVAFGPSTVVKNNADLLTDKASALALADDGSGAYDEFIAYVNTLD